MLLDVNREDSVEGRAFDVCIVGAGPAGISLALELSQKKLRVALCEAGDLEPSQQSQDCYKGEIIGDPYFDLDVARLRYFGGTSGHWGGQCRGFEEIDFDRGYIDTALRWPIKKSDLDPYMKKACDILEIKVPGRDEVLSKSIGVRSIAFSYSPPVRFGEKYKAQIENSKSISLFLNANLKKLDVANRRVKSALFQSYSGRRLIIEASKFVLAMGGIENSRQLLWQQELNNGGLYDADLPVGRYWMEHPHFELGEALLDTRLSRRRFFALSASKQKELGILNCGLRVEEQGASETKRLIKDLLCVAPKLGAWVTGLAGKKLICGMRFAAAWEQLPTPSNRIVLSTRRKDQFGIPLTRLFWKKTVIDYNTIKSSVAVFNDYLLQTNFGRIKLDDWISKGMGFTPDSEAAGYHHMGGTRMGISKAYGVVDRDCRVFGSENLYVSGSSVFTTGGHNNPTLPIVQLALRLANKLS